MYNIFRDHLGTITHLKTGSTISEYSFDAWGRRRDRDDWTYTLSGEPALFADRGFTAHEYLEDFKLYNMNGRMYDPVVGRFLSPDPYVLGGDFSQNFNRYSYGLNNPLRYNDLSGYTWGIFKPFAKFGKWVWNDALPALDPVVLMQKLNDKTEKLREKMSDAGIPDFSIGGSVNLDGNVHARADVMGQEVFNTQNIDRSNAEQKVNQMLDEVRQAYGDAWMEASYGGYYSGEIKQYNPGFFDRWSESSNPIGRISYDLVDGISVTAQSFILGPKAMHMNGSEVIGDERVDAFVNTAEWGLAFGGMYSQYARTGGKSLVDITLSQPRFRLQVHTHARSALKGRGAAGSIKAWHLNLNNTHLYFNPKYWKYYYPWWRL